MKIHLIWEYDFWTDEFGQPRQEPSNGIWNRIWVLGYLPEDDAVEDSVYNRYEKDGTKIFSEQENENEKNVAEIYQNLRQALTDAGFEVVVHDIAND